MNKFQSIFCGALSLAAVAVLGAASKGAETAEASGSMQDFRTLWLSDKDRTNHVVEISLENNERLFLDFNQHSLAELDLDLDDAIKAKGLEYTIGGRTVLKASEVWIGGKKTIFDSSR